MQEEKNDILEVPSDSEDFFLSLLHGYQNIPELAVIGKELEHFFTISKDNVINLLFDNIYFDLSSESNTNNEDNSDDSTSKQLRLALLKLICDNMKKSRAIRIELFTRCAFNQEENNLLIDAYNTLIKSGTLKKIEFRLFGYHDELKLLAQLYENIILNNHSPSGHALEHVNFNTADFPIGDDQFIACFDNEQHQNFEGSINKLPPSIQLRCQDEEDRKLVCNIILKNTTLKKLRIFEVGDLYENYEEGTLEPILWQNHTLININLENSALEPIIALVTERNKLIAAHPERTNLIKAIYDGICFNTTQKIEKKNLTPQENENSTLFMNLLKVPAEIDINENTDYPLDILKLAKKAIEYRVMNQTHFLEQPQNSQNEDYQKILNLNKERLAILSQLIAKKEFPAKMDVELNKPEPTETLRTPPVNLTTKNMFWTSTEAHDDQEAQTTGQQKRKLPANEPSQNKIEQDDNTLEPPTKKLKKGY